jgi:hypothetical protein
MSTRGAIARWTDPKLGTWAGVSHHFDAAPTGLGATLYNLAALKVLGELPSMLKVLIDEHPAGWSTINNADWRLAPGFVTSGPPDGRPICYCHGERSEDGQMFTDANAATRGVEWAYVFDTERETMTVLEARVDGKHSPARSGFSNPKAQWVQRWVVRLDEDVLTGRLPTGLAIWTPDWRAMEE